MSEAEQELEDTRLMARKFYNCHFDLVISNYYGVGYYAVILTETCYELSIKGVGDDCQAAIKDATWKLKQSFTSPEMIDLKARVDSRKSRKKGYKRKLRRDK